MLAKYDADKDGKLSKDERKAISKEDDRLRRRFGASLSNEQVSAIRHILNPHQLSCVVGLAGAASYPRQITRLARPAQHAPS